MDSPLVVQLKHALHDAAGLVSYYNAAEGQAYRNEAKERQKAQFELLEIRKKCEEAGIDVQAELSKGHYLL